MDDQDKQAYIFASIFALSNKLQVLGDKFDPRITVKQWLFMVGVAQFAAPPTVSEVANFVGYSRQNAKRMASALASRGFVQIERDSQDARALRISLTPRCTAYFQQRSGRELDFLNQLFSGFNTDLTEGFYQGLAQLAINITDMLKDIEPIDEE